MTGKSKCKILKTIRREIAEQNGIELVTEECRYKGECSGTCPKCEAEVRYLEKELKKRQSLGKKIAVAGLVAALAVTAPGCGNDADLPENPPKTETEETYQATAGIFTPPPSQAFQTGELSFSKVLGLTGDDRLDYVSAFSRDEIRTEWDGTLTSETDETDVFCLKTNRSEYDVTVTYDSDEKPTDIAIIDRKTGLPYTNVIVE